jgi:hypothetical protein
MSLPEQQLWFAQDYWQQVESYIASHASVQFSHGICPACYAEHMEPMLRGGSKE